MGAFADIADPIDASPAPKGKPARFADIADPVPKPVLQFKDPAAARSKIAALGDPALLAQFDKQYPQAKNSAPVAAPALVNGGLGAVNPHRNIPPIVHVPGTADIVPGGTVPGTPDAPETWWDKAKGLAEAGATTIAAVPAGIVGAVHGLMTPSDPRNKMAQDQQAGRTTDAILNWVTAGSPSQAGQRYLDNIAPVANVLGAVAPMNEFQALASRGAAPVSRAAGDATASGMDALKQQFRTNGGGVPVTARVEPTLVKPRYGVVNGKIQRIDEGAPQPATQAAQAAPAPAPAPTLATASPDLQAAINKARSAGATNPAVEQAHIVADSLPVPIQLTKGQATGDPALISAEMNTRGKAQPLVAPEFYQKQGQAVAANMDAIRAKAAPDVPTSASMIDHGQTLLDAYKQMDAPIRADISAKYKALSDANGGNLPLNGAEFVQSADAALAKANKAYFLPAEVKSLMSDLREGGPMTYDAFENLRTILGAEERKYAGKDGNAAHAISLVRDSLESLPMTGEAANIKPLADAARQAAAARFAAIKADPAYKAAVTDTVPAGEPSPLADGFFNAYVLKGDRANLALLRKHLNNDPTAMQTVAAGTLDHLSKQLGAGKTGSGTFSQAQYNSALSALKPKFGVMLDPETAQHVQALGETARRLQQQPRGSYVNNSNTLVGALSDAAKSGVEGFVNVKAGGIPVATWARQLATRRANEAASRDAIAPGAGVTLIKEVGR